MRKSLAVFLILVLVAVWALAQTDNNYDEYVQQAETKLDDYSEAKAFEEFMRQQDLEFQAYVREQEAAYNKFVREVEQKWNEFIGSTQTQWVDYGKNKDVMSVVNFEESDVQEKESPPPTGEKKLEPKHAPGTENPQEQKPAPEKKTMDSKPESQPQKAQTQAAKSEPDIQPEKKSPHDVPAEPEVKPPASSRKKIESLRETKSEPETQKLPSSADQKPPTGVEKATQTSLELKQHPEPKTETPVKQEPESKAQVEKDKPEPRSEKTPVPAEKTESRIKPAEEPEKIPQETVITKANGSSEGIPEPPRKTEKRFEAPKQTDVKPEIKPETGKLVAKKAEATPEANVEDAPQKQVKKDHKGEIVVEAIVPVEDPTAKQKAKRLIASQVEKIFSDKNPAKENILKNQVKTKEGKTVTPENVKEFAEQEVVPRVKFDPETIKSRDGVERLRATVVIRMVPNHLRVRAQTYLRTVKAYCAKYQVDVPLVMAVIQTESFFNPLAKSSIPAYGLMQLVPKYAGRDAYKYVFKKEKEPKPDYLYVARNNLLLGIAYIRFLRENFFYGIKDPAKQEYLIIAAYNGGMGRVIRKVVKKYRIPEMSPPQVYDALRKEMPDETKDYLAKVSKRKANYLAWR